MKIPKGGIAFFDSGIGGLTVLDACRKRLPDALFYYYGDNKHAPYGNLPPRKIYRYTRKAFLLFSRLKVRAVVIACNTVTAVCIQKLRKKFKFPIIGTEPAVQSAAKKGGEIYVLSTRATFTSEKFHTLCKNVQTEYPKAKITTFSCDDLAGAIERHIQNSNFDFTPYLPSGNPNTVVLGCTHYIYIEEAVKRFYHCEVINGNAGIAARLASVIKKQEEKSFGFNQNREGRPRLTTKENENGNPDDNLPKKQLKMHKKAEMKGEIYFLGKSQVVNKTQYEQMFVYKFTQKAGVSGQKNQKKLKK